MKLRLFHAPYVDEDGLNRQRLSGVLSGLDPTKDSDTTIAKSIGDSLRKCAEGEVLLIVTDDMEVEWL